MDRSQQLLAFLYQTPVAIIEVDESGEIGLMNPLAAQYLLPLTGGKRASNLIELLEPYLPDLGERFRGFREASGEIFRAERLRLGERQFRFDLRKVSGELHMALLQDITEVVEREGRMQEVVAREAEERGKSEIAAGVLHDIGNAVTALGTSVARSLGELNWKELSTLSRVSDYLSRRKDELDALFGESKGSTLVELLDELSNQLELRHRELEDALNEMAGTLSHVSEILNIQRVYTSGKNEILGRKVDLRRVIEDALEMQASTLASRGIRVHRNYPEEPVAVRGDRTKLVRVVMNLIRNSAEAFDRRLEEEENREIHLSLRLLEGRAEATFEDNGPGFVGDSESSKGAAGGLGLKGVRDMVEAHAGGVETGDSRFGGAVIRFWMPSITQEEPGG